MDEQAKRLALFVAGILTVWTVRITLLHDFEMQFPTTWQRIGVSTVFRILFLLVPVIVYVRLIDRENVLRSLRLAKPSISWISGTVIVCVAWQFAALWWGFDEIGPKVFRSAAAGAVAAPFIEEVLSRGFALTHAQRFTTFWNANIMAALFFVAIHVPAWLMVEGLGVAELARGSIWIFCFGLAMGYLLKLSNTLWVPIIAHAANNFISAV